MSFSFFFEIFGAEDRNRTGTALSNRRILSPVRLPISPPRQSDEVEVSIYPVFCVLPTV